jgi:hypothetical protein
VKYLIMMFGCAGQELQARDPEWINGMNDLMQTLEAEMRDAGELVASVGLVDPSAAVTVRPDAGAPAVTDGPFAEIKESLAGYWLVETDERRAIAITSRVVEYVGHPMEVRRVMHDAAPPEG